MPVEDIYQIQRTGTAPFSFAFEYNIAFQPIFDLGQKRIWAYEALLRGPNGESASDVIASIPAFAKHEADQRCRETAIAMATHLGMTEVLSLNVLRSALLAPTDYIEATLDCADENGFPTNRILFEFSETEYTRDIQRNRGRVNRHALRGFMTAMDDFGAGYQGLSLLCDVRPDVIKLDMSLIRGVNYDPRRAIIVGTILDLCHKLHVRPVVEGVETQAELDCLRALGVEFVQGFLLARPQPAQLLTPKQVRTALKAIDKSLQCVG